KLDGDFEHAALHLGGVKGDRASRQRLARSRFDDLAQEPQTARVGASALRVGHALLRSRALKRPDNQSVVTVRVWLYLDVLDLDNVLAYWEKLAAFLTSEVDLHGHLSPSPKILLTMSGSFGLAITG